MTVRELIKELKALPQDQMVILQKDAEGNNYSPLVGTECALYLAENTWSGEVWHPEDIKDLESDELDDFQNVVVLSPTN